MMLLSCILLVACTEQAKPSRLAVIQEAPSFKLTTQAGGTFGSDDLKGKVAIVSFVFTTCNGTCPPTTHRMALLQRTLREKGLLKEDQVRLVSISLDPKRDTPEVLRGYAGVYDADPKHWTFLTGDPADVDKVLDKYGIWVKPAANGQIDHPTRVFLIDQRGNVREIYSLATFKAEWVVEDVELLLGK